jgi:hypothetical protein
MGGEVPNLVTPEEVKTLEPLIDGVAAASLQYAEFTVCQRPI